nr:hypothetical protein [Campylobacter jejuni]
MIDFLFLFMLVEIANESAIISSTVSDIANNILEDVKKKRF